MLHATTGLKRLLVAVFAALLLGAFTILPALASGSGTWTTTGSLNTARYYAPATRLQNGQVLVVGGLDSYYDILASTELYTPATGQWTLTGSLNVARLTDTAVLLQNGEVLVAGGEAYDDYYNTIFLASAELYTPATGTWTTTGSMHVARFGSTMTLLPNGQVLAAGGDNGGDGASAELYNPTTGTWTLTGSMHVQRSGQTATLLPNGQVLVAGGNGASAELYNPTTGTWTTTGSMTIDRHGQTATLLTNGQVLVAGGYSGTPSYHVLSSAELYNPATGQWTLTGSMSNVRASHTATLLQNGQVLVAGGHGPYTSAILASAELYNPATGTWTTTGSLNFARVSHTATLLNNGQVLVAGGVASSGYAVAIAELYTP